MLPKGWKRVKLEKVADVRTGLAKGKTGLKEPVELPYLRVANVQDGHLNLDEIKTIWVERSQVDRYRLKPGDVLMTEGGDFDKLGRGDVWRGQIPLCLHQNHVFVVRPHQDHLNSAFLAALAASEYGRNYFLSCAKRSTNLASINASQLKAFPVLMPKPEEQREIAGILAVWDAAIMTAERLLTSSRVRKQALSSRILFGEARLAPFNDASPLRSTRCGRIPVGWSYPKIDDVAKEISMRQTDGDPYHVLSCTKHAGLVDSLKYFKKQVFSKDLSTYKMVPRGAFAYATNHIEEGAIGYQNLYDFALVSPIYTVFETVDCVYDDYLYRVLKTERFRQVFEAATNSSVDRRGSLRWSDFKKIHVPLPSLEEQVTIAAVLDKIDSEVALLEKQIQALRAEKSALMQQLLTGKRRLRLPASSEARSA